MKKLLFTAFVALAASAIALCVSPQFRQAVATTFPQVNIYGLYSTSITSLTTGNSGALQSTKYQVLVVTPYGKPDDNVAGTATSTDTAAHTIIASAGGSLKNYVTDVQCGRTDTGTTAIVVTFSDAQSTVMIVPPVTAGGGNNMHFSTPIATAAATAFTMTSGTGVSTLYCNAQGAKQP